jgi:hypothetical protein
MEKEPILCEEAREQHSMPLFIGDLFHKTVDSERQQATTDRASAGAKSRAKVAIRGGEGRGHGGRFDPKHGEGRSGSFLGNLTSLDDCPLKIAAQF